MRRRLAAAGIVALGAVVATRWDLPARLMHPARYALSAGEPLSSDAYAAAARAALPTGMRIATVALPARGDPVVVTATRDGVHDAWLFLDPPTARRLGAQTVTHTPQSLPVALPVRTAAAVTASGARIVGDAAPALIEWPTIGRPDWHVVYRDGRRVGVADDDDIAAFAPASPIVVAGHAVTVRTMPWPASATAAAVAGAVALACVAGWRGRQRRRSPPRRKRRPG